MFESIVKIVCLCSAQLSKAFVLIRVNRDYVYRDMKSPVDLRLGLFFLTSSSFHDDKLALNQDGGAQEINKVKKNRVTL